MKEIFKDIKGYEGIYQISNFGKVKSLSRYSHNLYGKIRKERIIKPFLCKGYLRVNLVNNKKHHKFFVHKLVAQEFISKINFKSMPNENRQKININKLKINHKDENKLNNKVDNLEWCTDAYNVNYGTRTQRSAKKYMKQIYQYDLQNNFIKEWNSITEASNKLKICFSCISCCINKKRKTAGGYIWKLKEGVD